MSVTVPVWSLAVLLVAVEIMPGLFQTVPLECRVLAMFCVLLNWMALIPRGMNAENLAGCHRAATPAGVGWFVGKPNRWYRRGRDATTGYWLRSLQDRDRAARNKIGLN